MNRSILSVIIFWVAVLFPNTCLAVDQTSGSYKAGQVFGTIFLIVIAFLIVKKIMRKS
jgi:hypothetical protein